MKRLRERCGSTLLEVVVSVAVLGLLVVPISSGILMSMRINEKSDDMLRARLAVSSAVETIMAEGIASAEALRAIDLPGVNIDEDIRLTSGGYWTLTVRSEEFSSIFVEMCVRADALRTPEGGGA